MTANHLAREKSPYLLQHAHNPVDWFPWGDEAFDKARRENKPILLSVGYSTCHWCHVMAHESFEDEGIAEFLNGHFVSIKVDREERPDIDHIYMTAVTSMTGQGGWPLTVFLTPEAMPFYGGTYFPPYAKWGAPGFLDLLKSVSDAWGGNKEQIQNSAKEITDLLRSHAKPQDGDGVMNLDCLDTAARQMMGSFDHEFGGFGKSPKFPMGHNLSYLLRYYKRTNDVQALDVVTKTLDAMAHGGIYDHLGGGFHRYATDQKWHVPHFEKMLYDQALLVIAYAEAYQITGDLKYARVVGETLDYVLRDMTLPQGGYYSAEDADSEAVPAGGSEAVPAGGSEAVPAGGSEGKVLREGAFYVWSAAEIAQILSPEEMELLNRYYGVLETGNVAADPHGEFIGKNILSRVIVGGDDEPVLDIAKDKLFCARNKRSRPHLDDKILSDWNGLMIAAFAFAGSVMGEERYVKAACQAADFILDNLYSQNGLLHRFRDGDASIDGMLEDYAFFCFGLINLYEATFDRRYLKEAEGLVDRMCVSFEDKEHGGFFMTAEDAGLIVRSQDVYDGALPSGNSAAAYVLVKLHYITGRDDLKLKADALFRRFKDIVGKSPQAYSFFLTAYDLHVFPPDEITFYGDCCDSSIVFLRKVVYKQFMPRRVFKAVARPGAWSVAVCRNGTCHLPVSDLQHIEQLIT